MIISGNSLATSVSSFTEASGSAQIVYVRTGGNGNGSSASNAFGTMEDALNSLRRFTTQKKWVIDCTDFTWSDTQLRTMPAIMGSFSEDLNLSGGAIDFSAGGLLIKADPTLVQAITVTTAPAESVTTGRFTVNVSETLVVNDHVGQLVLGGLSEYGVVISNTTSALTVQSYSGIDATNFTGIYEQSATFRFGDSGNFFEGCLQVPSYVSIAFSGIRFEPTAGKTGFPAVVTSSIAPMSFVGCSFDGMAMNRGLKVTHDGCYFEGPFVQDGAPNETRASFLDGVSFLSHGGGGVSLSAFSDCTIDGASEFGAGATLTDYSFDVLRCHIDNSADHGVHMNGSARSRVRDSAPLLRGCSSGWYRAAHLLKW